MSEFNRTIDFTVTKEDTKYDAGAFLKSKGVSRRLITKLKRIENGICRNGITVRTIDRIYEGDIISVKMEDSRTLNGNLELAVPVVYDDEDVVVFNKPVNMPVHPSIKHQGDTLGNCFSAMYPGLTFRPVNRLDKDTSGLCVVAKNAHSANLLQSTVSKVYYAAVCGVLEGGGRINAPIGRVSESIILRQVMADGQEAVTDYDVVTTNGRYTLVKVTPITGRTHQIRVHFSYIGHPLAGDDMYGGDTSDIKEQALHCGEISFVHPVSKEKIFLKSQLREDIARLFPNIM